jgi:hypothetical protein
VKELRQFVSVARRLLALATLLALVLLVTHSVVHWHGSGHREDHCQVCHVGHAAIPQPSVQVAPQAPTLVARVAIRNASAPHLEFLSTPSIPRAPPA